MRGKNLIILFVPFLPFYGLKNTIATIEKKKKTTPSFTFIGENRIFSAFNVRANQMEFITRAFILSFSQCGWLPSSGLTTSHERSEVPTLAALIWIFSIPAS